MSDFIFTDPTFASTKVDVRPGTSATETGKAQWGEWFGTAAVSATLAKSGAYEMMEAIDKAGLTYQVREGSPADRARLA